MCGRPKAKLLKLEGFDIRGEHLISCASYFLHMSNALAACCTKFSSWAPLFHVNIYMKVRFSDKYYGKGHLVYYLIFFFSALGIHINYADREHLEFNLI